MLHKHSLAYTTLIKMGFRIALVIIAVTLVSYWHVVSILESQTIEQLKKYIVERGHRESQLFQLAEDNHVLFNTEFLARYQAMGNQDPLAEFNQLFEQTHDGLVKMRVDYYSGHAQTNGLTIKGVFGSFSPKMTLTPSLRRVAMIVTDLLSQYGPAWRSRFFDAYAFTPEELFLGYWPEVLWYPQATSGYEMASQEWFYVADLQHNPHRQTVWTGAYYDEISKVWLVSCVTPLDVEGKHLLSMGSDVKLSDLFGRTIENHIEGATNLIFRTDGRLLAHPEYMKDIEKTGGLFDMRRDGNAELRHLFELVKQRPSGTVVIDDSKDNNFLAVTNIEGPDWYLVIVYPKSLLATQAFNTARWILILGILSLLLEVAILFWVLRTQIAQPLQRFIEATQRIASGHFDILLDTRREDELGLLAYSFNLMAAGVANREIANQQIEDVWKEYNHRLEHEIAERTSELAENNRLLQQKMESLRENETRYRILFEESPVSLWEEDFSGVKQAIDKLRESGITDVSSYFKKHPEIVIEYIPLVKVIDVNQATLTLYKATSKEQLLGNLNHIVVDAVAAFTEEFSAIAEGKTALSLEIDNLTLQGEVKQILFKMSAVPEFNYAKVFVSLVDITERKRAEQFLQEYNQRLEQEIAERTKALRESEERFDLALRGANDGLWDWNIQTNRTYLSPRYCQIIGLPTSSEVGLEEFLQWIHPEDAGRVNHILQAYLSKHTPSYEIVYRVKQVAREDYLWLLSRGTAVWNEQGQPLRMVGTIMNITAHKQAEAKLQAALNELQRFKTMLDFTLDGIYMEDAQTFQFFYANQGAVAQVGYTQAELLQMTPSDLLVNFSSEQIQEMANRLRNSTPPSITLEAIIRRKDGSLFPIELFLQYIAIHDQGYFIAFVRDITERKQAELALQAAKEAAEAANVAKSTFLANMSHELRTPLNGVLGYTQILSRDKTLTAKQQEGIGIIQRSGEYLLTLINDVLDLSKIEAGRVELYPVDINFSHFLQGIRELFQMRAEQKHIAFIFEPLSRLPTGIQADEKRLRQILINLLGNAVKFTEKGGVTLKVGYDPDNRFRFQVEDTGIGIDQQELDRIFLPFQQVGHQSYRAEGTGLGLSITKKLVEMMGGELRVTSVLGQGSTFWIVLDLPETDLISTTVEEKPMIIGFQGPPRKILVVDDKWENRLILINLLTSLGFDVLEANHGKEGLEMAQRWSPDLILSDLVMPVMDGFELTRQLRNIPQFQTVPVIAVSASVFDWHQQESVAAGCNDFVPKPIRTEVLLEVLRKHLELTWIYEEPELTVSKEIPVHSEESATTLVGPAPDQATELYELVMMGDITGILDTLEAWEQTESQLGPFIRKFRQLAKNFEEKQMEELIRQYVTD